MKILWLVRILSAALIFLMAATLLVGVLSLSYNIEREDWLRVVLFLIGGALAGLVIARTIRDWRAIERYERTDNVIVMADTFGFREGDEVLIEDEVYRIKDIR